MEIALDYSAPTPLYRQLAECLRGEIQSGLRPPGSRMPAEDELVRQADVSKGTVKSAYAMLRREGLLTAVRGSGTYVCDSSVSRAVRDPQAQIRQFFAAACGSGESTADAFRLFRRQLDLVYANASAACVALIGCNWEALHPITRQLEEILGLRIVPYLLGDLLEGRQEISSQCQLILTTHQHYLDVVRYAGRLGVDIAELAIKEGDLTVAALSKLPKDRPVCIVYRSESYLNSVRSSLRFLSFDHPISFVSEERLEALEECAAKQISLILPPDYTEHTVAAALQIIERARKNGCHLISFQYEVEQGSLLHLQNRLESVRRG